MPSGCVRILTNSISTMISSLLGEAPRLWRGGSRSLTFQAVVHRRNSRLVSHHAHEKEFAMHDYESLSHSKWECKYHVVFIPKCRRKSLKPPALPGGTYSAMPQSRH